MKEPGPNHPIVITPHAGRVRITAAGQVLAETNLALSLREASYSPVLYIPRGDIHWDLLTRNAQVTRCPYKGEAHYFDLTAGATIRESIAWSYETPFPAVSRIRECLAFYPDRVDAIETIDTPGDI